jgi:hypothetical protein
MSTEPNPPVVHLDLGEVERALIDEFVRMRGYDPSNLAALTDAERLALLRAASIHASGRLSEVESRSHYVHDLHGAGPHATKAGLE